MMRSIIIGALLLAAPAWAGTPVPLIEDFNSAPTPVGSTAIGEYNPLVIAAAEGDGHFATFTLHEGAELCGPFDAADSKGNSLFHLDADSRVGGTLQDLVDGKIRHAR